jgi:ribose-phosphate pyrophosphokinase
MDEFVTGMMVADSFRERGGRIRNLVIPYIPGGRQDRLKWEGDWLYTLKWVAKQINAQEFDKVITYDPHSMATAAMINRLHVPDLWFTGDTGRDRYAGVIAPDLGATKRAEEFGHKMGKPVFHASKVRDPKTNKLSGFHFLDTLVPDQTYLVVDDLCDAGGTFVGLAQEAAKVYGVRLDLFVTHGLFTKGFDELLKHYNRIHTTDSVERVSDTPLVNVIPITRRLAEYV